MAMPAMVACSGLRAPERMPPAQLGNSPDANALAHPMNDGLSLPPQAEAVSFPPQPARRSVFPKGPIGPN